MSSAFGFPLTTTTGLQLGSLSEGFHCHTTQMPASLWPSSRINPTHSSPLRHCLASVVLDLSESGFDFHLITAQRQPFAHFSSCWVSCNQVGAKGNQTRAQLPYRYSDLRNLERHECLSFQWRKSECHISIADHGNWQTSRLLTNGMKRQVFTNFCGKNNPSILCQQPSQCQM